MRSKGFTLIEVLVVIGIIGILLGLSYTGYLQWARKEEVTTVAKDILADMQNMRSTSSRRNVMTELAWTSDTTYVLRVYPIGVYADSAPPLTPAEETGKTLQHEVTATLLSGGAVSGSVVRWLPPYSEVMTNNVAGDNLAVRISRPGVLPAWRVASIGKTGTVVMNALP